MTESRIDRAELFVAAPAERIYSAFLDADAIAQWLPPEGASAVVHAFDPRPGGTVRMTLIFADADHAGKTTAYSDELSGWFVELVPDERIVEAFEFVSEDPAFTGTMTMTWTLTLGPDGTLVNVAAENVPHGIDSEQHAQGLASSLANLAAFVTRS